MTYCLIAINYKSVSVMVAEIWLWVKRQFYLDLIFEVMHTDISSLIVSNNKSVSLAVILKWLIEKIEDQFDLNLISYGHQMW